MKSKKIFSIYNLFNLCIAFAPVLYFHVVSVLFFGEYEYPHNKHNN